MNPTLLKLTGCKALGLNLARGRPKPMPRLSLRPRDPDGAGIVRAQRVREFAARVTQIAEHAVAVRLNSVADPLHEIVERLLLLGHAEPAVPRDAVDPLHQQVLLAGRSNRPIERLLKVNRNEQVARSVHGHDRTLDLAVERHELVERSHRVSDFGVSCLAPYGRVELCGRETKVTIERVLVVSVRYHAVRRRRASSQRGAADV